MSRIYPGQLVYRTFYTYNPTTGGLANPGSTPVVSVKKNGVVDGAVTGGITNPNTGEYVASFTVPSDYVDTDSVELCAVWNFSGVAGRHRDAFFVETTRNSTLLDFLRSVLHTLTRLI